jgi:hypothetical protein
VTNEELIELYSNLGVDILDLEADGWNGCETCPRKALVKSPKFECDFSECLENFVNQGFDVNLRKLEII